MKRCKNRGNHRQIQESNKIVRDSLSLLCSCFRYCLVNALLSSPPSLLHLFSAMPGLVFSGKKQKKWRKTIWHLLHSSQLRVMVHIVWEVTRRALILPWYRKHLPAADPSLAVQVLHTFQLRHRADQSHIIGFSSLQSETFFLKSLRQICWKGHEGWGWTRSTPLPNSGDLWFSFKCFVSCIYWKCKTSAGEVLFSLSWLELNRLMWKCFLESDLQLLFPTDTFRYIYLNDLFSPSCIS